MTISRAIEGTFLATTIGLPPATAAGGYEEIAGRVRV
jgi:hypothetical protein